MYFPSRVSDGKCVGSSSSSSSGNRYNKEIQQTASITQAKILPFLDEGMIKTFSMISSFPRSVLVQVSVGVGGRFFFEVQNEKVRHYRSPVARPTVSDRSDASKSVVERLLTPSFHNGTVWN